MSSRIRIPESLHWLGERAAGRAWLAELPRVTEECLEEWSLRPGLPYSTSSVSLVVPVSRTDGSAAVLKVQFPHRESAGEAKALRLWAGRGAVRLLDDDTDRHALLIERCVPGVHLSTQSPQLALDVMVELLPRLWISPSEDFTSLAREAGEWVVQLPRDWEQAGRPFERRLLDAAIEVLSALAGTQGEQVLIHQDLHGDNVLSAQREPWLAIDPKPLTGEREFGVVPIVRSYEFGHSRGQVVSRLHRLTSELGLDRDRALAWSLGGTLAWSIEGDRPVVRHVETARWLAKLL